MANREITPYEQFRGQIEKARPEFVDAFPSQWKRDDRAIESHFGRIKRVLNDAFQADDKLARADRRSLIGAAIKCARDGLLPDGREGAMVRFFDSKAGIDRVQYMPMVYGLIKLARQSGEVVFLQAKCVYENDEFDYWIDEDGEHLRWKPGEPPDNLDDIKAVFAMARLKDGTNYIEVMSVKAVEKRRAVSKMAAGPKSLWEKWKPEMYVKTAIRQLMKRLPRIVDLDDVIVREEIELGMRTVDHEPAPPKKQPALTHAKEEGIDVVGKPHDEKELAGSIHTYAEELAEDERQTMPDERELPPRQPAGKPKVKATNGDDPSWLVAFEKETATVDTMGDLQELYDAVWDGPAARISPHEPLATRLQAIYSKAKARIQGFDPDTGEISE